MKFSVWLVLLILTAAGCARTQRPVATLDVGELPNDWRASSAAFANDGSLMAAVGDDGTVAVWSTSDGRRLAIAKADAYRRPFHLTYAGSRAMAMSGDVVVLPAATGVATWHWRDGETREYDLKLPGPPVEIVVARDGAIAAATGGLRYDPSTGKRSWPLDPISAGVVAVDGSITTWATDGTDAIGFALTPDAAGLLIRTVDGFGEAIRDVIENQPPSEGPPPEKALLSLHELPSGRLRWASPADAGASPQIAVSARGTLLAETSYVDLHPGTLLRDTRTGRPLAKLGIRESWMAVRGDVQRPIAVGIQAPYAMAALPAPLGWFANPRPRLRWATQSPGEEAIVIERVVDGALYPMALSRDGRRLLARDRLGKLAVWAAPR